MNGRPLVFGEVLFDRFPDGSEVLGGAPFNVAWHLQGFGAAPLFVSRVGADAAGERVLQAMGDWGMDTAALQLDPVRATGAVAIALQQGEPSYRIDPDQAYGHIEAIDPAALPPPALVYHGSLALWGVESRHALDELLRHHDVPVFLDVNLRPPWWRAEAVAAWLARADWAKLNSTELDRLAPGTAPPMERAEALCRDLGLRQVVVTLGSEGAFAVDADGGRATVAPAAAVGVVDTVGAGDAFAAVLILGLLAGWEPAATLRRAHEFAAALVGVRGATVAERAFYRGFLENWRCL